jgi:2-octaprenyl-6-methoxyphenol hydroxylase
MVDFTTIVSGAGPAGLAAAVLLAQDGVKVAVIAPAPSFDPRTTALMQPSLQLLKFIGVWEDELRDVSAQLKHLHLIDDTGNLVSATPLHFNASELNLDAFGWNVPLAHLIPLLKRRALSLGVTFIEGQTETAQCADEFVTLKMSDGKSYSAQVLLAADGADSKLRGSLGIGTENWNYDQSAMATSFSHSADHEFISTEFHKSGGPFTTVPLPGKRSSLVWMDRPARIAALNELSDAELAIEIQLETHGKLGRVSEIGPRKVFVMRGQRALSFAKNRCMMIGEAAHILPPIGAQGLNLSLRDAAQAADLIVGAPDAGAAALLAEYDALRRADVLPRQNMVGFMNASFLSAMPAYSLARAIGLSAIANLPPLRGFAMSQGLAPSANLPFAMRG